MKTFRYISLTLLAIGSFAAAPAAFADQPRCPEGTTLVAKFEWNGGYTFEKPAGNEGIVTLSGSPNEASWFSQTDIDAIVLKGARDKDTIWPADSRSGSFTNENLETRSGRLAGISNVQFCGGDAPPPPPPPPGADCVECGEGANDANRIGELTMRYLGPTAHVVVYDHKVRDQKILFDGVLTTGEIFTVAAATLGNDRLGPKILLFADGVQVAEIHTSCSAPVTAGLTEQTQPSAKDPNGIADVELVASVDSRDREICGSDICVADSGPPQIEYSFEADRFVRVTITDDTGIASVNIELEDVAGGDPNLELVEENFVPGAMEATFLYRLRNFVQNTRVFVQATDLCDQVQCPDTDEAPGQAPSGNITGFGDRAEGFVVHPDGLQSFEFFRLVNVVVTRNTFIEGATRADFTVTRLDPAQSTGYGFIAASACNAIVIDPTTDYTGTGARGTTGLTSFDFSAPVSEMEASRSSEETVPTEFVVDQNYPNPFRQVTTISFSLPEATDVRVEVYNVLGKRVRVLAAGMLEAGGHDLRFDAGGLASGTYLYRIVTPKRVISKQMVLVD